MHRPHHQRRHALLRCNAKGGSRHSVAGIHVLVEPSQLLRLLQQTELLLRDKLQLVCAGPRALCTHSRWLRRSAAGSSHCNCRTASACVVLLLAQLWGSGHVQELGSSAGQRRACCKDLRGVCVCVLALVCMIDSILVESAAKLTCW